MIHLPTQARLVPAASDVRKLSPLILPGSTMEGGCHQGCDKTAGHLPPRGPGFLRRLCLWGLGRLMRFLHPAAAILGIPGMRSLRGPVRLLRLVAPQGRLVLWPDGNYLRACCV